MTNFILLSSLISFGNFNSLCYFFSFSLENEGWFIGFHWPEITPHIVRTIRSRFSLTIKWFILPDLSFHSIFFCFFLFLCFCRQLVAACGCIIVR